MWGSKPGETVPPKPPPTPKNRGATGFPWLAVSLVLHILVFVAMVCFTPVRNLVLPSTADRAPRETRHDANRLEELTDRLKDIHERELRIRVAELDAIRERMEETRRQTNQEQKRFSEEARASAAEQIQRDLIDADTLRREARTREQMEAQMRELQTVLRETEGTLTSARSMAEAANKIAGGEDGAFTLESARREAERIDLLRRAAAEDEDNLARDLASLMREGAAQGQGGPDVDGSDEGDDEGGNGLSGPMDTSPRMAQPPAHPPLDLRRQSIVHGRKLGGGIRSADWMAVTGWYIIGPWANPDRQNMETKFPPETLVNLDANYVGKDDRLLSWQFQQAPHSNRPLVEPWNSEEFGIWYAYTELFSDTPRDVWIAVGSDDHSRLWINDHLVWESVPWHKAWRPNKGFRRVHLGEGRNRILYRVENGHFAMGWSLLIHLDPQ